MGENSAISWTHHTFNPWVGCQRVSPGCTNCYAEAYDKRVGGALLPVPNTDSFRSKARVLRWGPDAPRVRTSATTWRQPLKWNKDAEKAGTRARVFCASLADVFEDRPELSLWRTRLFNLIMETPHLDWLLLTKRPQNIAPSLGDAIAVVNAGASNADLRAWLGAWVVEGVAPANVWLGTTVEDQQRANERIPALLSVPARVRFLSCEPLLEDLTGMAVLMRPDVHGGPSIDWCIIGGESGPKARPFNVKWAYSLMRQARAAKAKVFVKQLGSNFFMSPSVRVRLKARAGEDMAEWPEDLRVRQMPKGAL